MEVPKYPGFLCLSGSIGLSGRQRPKIGFREVGRLRAHIQKDGLFEYEIFMESFAEELE
ncbi:MAG: hypothetical protein ACOX5Q_01890 [Bacillota bacterium]|nr:hypothetical protein [Candidatus Fermentithermobacillaceae bacterium]